MCLGHISYVLIRHLCTNLYTVWHTNLHESNSISLICGFGSRITTFLISTFKLQLQFQLQHWLCNYSTSQLFGFEWQPTGFSDRVDENSNKDFSHCLCMPVADWFCIYGLVANSIIFCSFCNAASFYYTLYTYRRMFVRMRNSLLVVSTTCCRLYAVCWRVQLLARWQ